MPRVRLPSAVLALAVAILLSGCSSAGGDSRDGAIDLQSGGFKEIKVAMDKGDSLSWSWSTAGGQAVHFDFHTHKDGGAQTLKEDTSATGQGTFEAPEDGSYYLFWQYDGNGTAEMTYHMETEGKVTAEYQ